MAALPMLQQQGRCPALHGSVKVLDKQLFRAEGGVAGQVQQRCLGAFQHPLPPQRRGDAPQGAVPPCAVGPQHRRPAQGRPLLAACHKGAFIGDEQAVQKLLLAQHQGAGLLAGHLKGHIHVHRRAAVPDHGLGVDTVGLEMALQIRHIRLGLPGQPFQAFLQGTGQAVSHALHRIQSLLRLLGIDSRLRQRPSPLSGLGGWPRIFLLLLGILGQRAFKMQPAAPEHRLQNGINIVFHRDTILSKLHALFPSRFSVPAVVGLQIL